MTLDDLPLVERRLTIAGRCLSIAAVADQDALLRTADARKLLPFGLLLWESAVVLAEVATNASLDGVSVLELGAGVGLAGLAAAAAGADVMQTDIDPLAIELCQRNATRNGVSTVSAHVADWRTWCPTQRFDLILGADILYDRDEFGPIARLLSHALADGGQCLLADPRRPHTPVFLEQMRASGWTVEMTRETTEDLTWPDRSVEVDVLQLSR